MINLNAATIQTHTLGGVVVETNDTAVINSVLFDFVGMTVQGRFDIGTMNGQSFVGGPRATGKLVTISLIDGKWSAQDGAITGTLTGPQLTTVTTIWKQIRNGLESLGVSQGIIPGSQVNW